MFPTFELFGIQFASYYTFFAVGLIVAFLVFWIRAKKYQLSKYMTIAFGIFFPVLSLLFSKLMYIVAYLPYSLTNVSVTVGAESWGVFLMFPLLVFLFSRLYKVDYITLINCFTPGLCFYFAFAQIACYLNGCCEGIIIYDWQVPVQLIEACCGFCFAMYLLYKDQNCNNEANLYVITLIVHGSYRFLADFARNSKKDLLFSRGQWLAIIAVIVGMLIWKRLKKGVTCRNE